MVSALDRAGRRHVSLVWQLFAANAIVLVLATLALLLAPVSISSRPVLAEVLVVLGGLTVMLAADLLLLRRTLGPLRLLVEMMRTADPRRPGRRLPGSAGAAAEVVAMTEAFNDMLDRLENERRASARRALAAQEDERLRIARELHDEIGQTLTAITIQAERAADTTATDAELLRGIARTSLHALDDVRRIARELRPEALDDLGLGSALIALCRRMAVPGRTRLVPTVDHAAPMRAEVELVVYRIAQEALTNAVRHAGARRIELSLATADDDDSVVLVVRDDGRGLPEPLPEGTAGIAGMRERALLVGGHLTLGAGPGGGAVLRLVVPAGEAAP